MTWCEFGQISAVGLGVLGLLLLVWLVWWALDRLLTVSELENADSCRRSTCADLLVHVDRLNRQVADLTAVVQSMKKGGKRGTR